MCVVALGCAAVAPIVVAELARMVRERSLAISTHGRTADIALVTSATLMGVSDLGVDGSGGMGLWGPLVFTIPLLAAWYSYEHLERDPPHLRPDDPRARRRSGAGGIVRDGHAERVADDGGCRRRRELGFSRREIVPLETAALLHHLGQVCLDEPDDGRPPDPALVATSTAEILRGTQRLAAAGDIIAAESVPYRAEVGSSLSVLSGQVLKVASAFDELSEGLPERAVRRARSAAAPRPHTSTTRACWRRSRSCSTARGLLEPAT